MSCRDVTTPLALNPESICAKHDKKHEERLMASGETRRTPDGIAALLTPIKKNCESLFCIFSLHKTPASAFTGFTSFIALQRNANALIEP